MHGRGEHVGLETQQQLAHLGVGARSDISHFGFEVLARPWCETPVFIVDENAAVAHRRRFRHMVGAHKNVVVLLYRYVGPPEPWRYAHLLAHGESAIGCTAGIAADYEKCVASVADQEALVAIECGKIDAGFRCQFFYLAISGSAYYHHRFFTGLFQDGRAAACHGLKVGCEHSGDGADQILVGPVDIDVGFAEIEGAFGFCEGYMQGCACGKRAECGAYQTYDGQAPV